MTSKHVISSYNTLLEKTIVTEGWQIMRKQPYWLNDRDWDMNW